jgi:hypothetical protein
LNGWLKDLSDQLVSVDIEGNDALILADDLEELGNSSFSPTVRLLPGSDQWVMGPGTADPLVVPPHRRRLMTLGANPVLANGVVAGTWTVNRDNVIVIWFPEVARPNYDLLTQEVSRLAEATATDLKIVVEEESK